MNAFRKDGKIIVEISEEDLCFAVENSSYPIKVVNREKFLNFFTNNILSFGDNGDFDSQPAICSLFDRLIDTSVETDEGLEEIPNEHNRQT